MARLHAVRGPGFGYPAQQRRPARRPLGAGLHRDDRRRAGRRRSATGRGCRARPGAIRAALAAAAPRRSTRWPNPRSSTSTCGPATSCSTVRRGRGRSAGSSTANGCSGATRWPTSRRCRCCTARRGRPGVPGRLRGGGRAHRLRRRRAAADRAVPLLPVPDHAGRGGAARLRRANTSPGCGTSPGRG